MVSIELIVCCDKNYGIGYQNSIPWHIPEESKLFYQKTLDSVLIMGRKTVQGLPKLNRRIIYCITKNIIQTETNTVHLVASLDQALHSIPIYHPNITKIFIAGGEQVYRTALQSGFIIDKIHISILNTSYPADKFFPYNLIQDNFQISNVEKYEQFTHYTLDYIPHQLDERQYLKLLKTVLQAPPRSSRNGMVKSSFGHNLKFDLRNGFPLLTTKNMFFRGIVEELLFFLRGQTDTKLLEQKKVSIWKPNTTREFLDSIGKPTRREGIMGPMYGYQWRFFDAPYNEEKGGPESDGIDQLADILHTLKTDPTSRRIIMTDYNPNQASQGVLYPCHSLIVQFYVDGGFLDMSCYNRSQDLFLGTPFNIASSALLLFIIADTIEKQPRFLHLNLGDVHIYEQHVNAVKEQLDRLTFPFPKLEMKKVNNVKEIEELQFEDFKLLSYRSHPSIKAVMIA